MQDADSILDSPDPSAAGDVPARDVFGDEMLPGEAFSDQPLPDDIPGLYFWTLPFFWAFGPILLVIQVACIVHVYKTGRPYWWIWVIFAFSFFGVLAYIFLEIRPKWNGPGLQKILWNLKSQSARIQILRERLDHSPAINNRYALAAELGAAGRYEEQCEVLQKGKVGAFVDDAQLMTYLAEASLDAGRLDEATKLVADLDPGMSREWQSRHKVLQARVASQQGQVEEAEELFAKLMVGRRSEAPVYYYAKHLIRTGKKEEGRSRLRDILTRYRKGTSVWRYQEKQWFQAAKRLLKTAK